MNCKIHITVPGEHGAVCPRRHFAVWGTISSDEAIPDDCVLTSRLINSDGRVIRQTVSRHKNDKAMQLYRDDLTTYPEYMDEGHVKMRDFGFPELMTDKNGSVTDATVKSWYSNTEFKTFFVSATDSEHGLVFDDGIGMTDEFGNPYSAFDAGLYTVSVVLSDSSGNMLASDEKHITVAPAEKTVICRFNPKEHKAKMLNWANENGFTFVSDIIPGYLDSYLGVWLYHMGLLTMYRANDIALYASGKTHMFVYLISSDSTSYETELAYLESCGVVDDSQRFEAYCYDIGEAVIYNGKNEEQRGSIIKFGKDEYLHIYRIDTVNDSARENYYDLSGDSLISSSTGLECVTVKGETKIAITGVVKPYQMNRDDYIKRPDNTYEIKNRPSHIRYTFRCGDDMRVFDREMNMTRFDKKVIGDSVFEFYNLFDIDSTMKGKRYSVSVQVYDEYGALTPAASDLILNID